MFASWRCYLNVASGEKCLQVFVGSLGGVQKNEKIRKNPPDMSNFCLLVGFFGWKGINFTHLEDPGILGASIPMFFEFVVGKPNQNQGFLWRFLGPFLGRVVPLHLLGCPRNLGSKVIGSVASNITLTFSVDEVTHWSWRLILNYWEILVGNKFLRLRVRNSFHGRNSSEPIVNSLGSLLTVRNLLTIKEETMEDCFNNLTKIFLEGAYSIKGHQR